MPKNTLDTLEQFLQKTRRKLHDEENDYSDNDESPENYDEGYQEVDPDVNEQDEADKWLAEHDNKVKEEPEDDYSEYEPDEDEDAHQQMPAVEQQPTTPPVKQEAKSAPAEQEEDPRASRELQPTREEIADMRQYTRPWEQRARDKSRLEAQAHVNPVKHHQGWMVESRNLAHGNRQKAYEDFQNSKEYQEADPITQMEMDANFHKDWHEKNPSHLEDALRSHSQAHKKGEEAREVHANAKDEKIRHIAGGGAQPGAYSVEEGLQHAGQERGDEDSAPSGITQDRAASFAAGNQEFLNNYMKNYADKAKKPTSLEDMSEYDPGARADAARVLGEHPALKDPAKKKKVDAFFQRYHPLIASNAKRVLNKMGLDSKKGEIDYGLLHEAGMHGLFQAINDYNHDHPSKASFVTHLNRKVQGLMQTALKSQDEIPQELRTGAKRFAQAKQVASASPVTHTDKTGTTMVAPVKQPTQMRKPSHEIAAAHSPDVQDRLKRVATARAPLIRKAPKPEGS